MIGSAVCRTPESARELRFQAVLGIPRGPPSCLFNKNYTEKSSQTPSTTPQESKAAVALRGTLQSRSGFWRKPLEVASLVAQLVKNPPAIWETWVQSLGLENPLEMGRPRDRTPVSCIAGKFFYHLSHQGSPAFPEMISILTKSAKSLQPWGFYSRSKKHKIFALRGAYILVGKEVMIGGGERQKKYIKEKYHIMSAMKRRKMGYCSREALSGHSVTGSQGRSLLGGNIDTAVKVTGRSCM